MSEQTRTVAIHVPVLARVEGEGALDLRIEGGDITQLRLRIFEPPRFFEKFLEGRHYSEIPDLVARICGICPVAYQVTAAQALEKLFGVELSPWARAMRRVFYCGEWIQSHSLHIHLLAAPDFFGCGNAIELARIAPDEVRRGLRIQALGNELMDLFGARSVHPVGVRIGGFHAAPALSRIQDMRDKLRAALPEAEALVRWAARIPMPPDDQAFVSVAMRHPTAYAIETGAIAASDGLLIEADAYDAHFAERHEPHSTALFSTYHQQPYLVGPLARLNLNHDRLPARIQALLAETGLRAAEPQSLSQPAGTRSGNPAGAARSGAPARRLPGCRIRPGCRSPRAPAWQRAAPKRRAACCGIATKWTPTAAWSTRASCRRPARTRAASRKTCGCRCSTSGSTTRTTRCACTAKKSSATTTPAFPAPPIFCG